MFQLKDTKYANDTKRSSLIIDYTKSKADIQNHGSQRRLALGNSAHLIRPISRRNVIRAEFKPLGYMGVASKQEPKTVFFMARDSESSLLDVNRCKENNSKSNNANVNFCVRPKAVGRKSLDDFSMGSDHCRVRTRSSMEDVSEAPTLAVGHRRSRSRSPTRANSFGTMRLSRSRKTPTLPAAVPPKSLRRAKSDSSSIAKQGPSIDLEISIASLKPKEPAVAASAGRRRRVLNRSKSSDESPRRRQNEERRRRNRSKLDDSWSSLNNSWTALKTSGVNDTHKFISGSRIRRGRSCHDDSMSSLNSSLTALGVMNTGTNEPRAVQWTRTNRGGRHRRTRSNHLDDSMSSMNNSFTAIMSADGMNETPKSPKSSTERSLQWQKQSKERRRRNRAIRLDDSMNSLNNSISLTVLKETAGMNEPPKLVSGSSFRRQSLVSKAA